MTWAAPARSEAYTLLEDSSLFLRVRTWFTLLALFLMAMGGGMFKEQTRHLTLKVLKQGADPADSGTLLMMTAVMWMICLALMAKHLVPTFQMMVKQKAMLGFAVLALVSTLWSQVPALTARKAVILFLTMAFAWFFAKYYSPGDQMRILLALGVIMGVGSVLWGVLLPNYGVQPTGEWKGIFGQKNFLGGTMFFLFSALPFCRIDSVGRLLKLALQAALPIGLILLSQSRSSLILVVVLISVRALGPMITRSKRGELPFLIYSAGLSVVFLVTCVVVILPLLGRDLTLTGRTRNWAVILPFAFKYVWLGYGYQGFWVGPAGDSGKVDVILNAGQNVADNGYLDLMLQFGFAGMGLLFALLIQSVRDFVLMLGRSSVPLAGYWYAGLIIAIFIGSFAEGMFFMPIRIVSFIFAMACAGLYGLSEQDETTYGLSRANVPPRGPRGQGLRASAS
jgi:exopolysaccharide production protein ExoQ